MKRIPIGQHQYQYMYVENDKVVALVGDIGTVNGRHMWGVTFLSQMMNDNYGTDTPETLDKMDELVLDAWGGEMKKDKAEYNWLMEVLNCDMSRVGDVC